MRGLESDDGDDDVRWSVDGMVTVATSLLASQRHKRMVEALRKVYARDLIMAPVDHPLAMEVRAILREEEGK